MCGISRPLSWLAFLLWTCFLWLLQLWAHLLILLCIPLSLTSFRRPFTLLGPFLCMSTALCLLLSLDLSHCNEMDFSLPWYLFGPDSPTLKWVQKSLGPFLLHLCIPRCLALSGHIISVIMCWVTRRTNPDQWPSYNRSYWTLLQCYKMNHLSKDSVPSFLWLLCAPDCQG